MSRGPRVYIPNKSSQDFRAAERFGDLTFVTAGSINRFDVPSLYRIFAEALEDAEEQDYLVVGGLSILVAIPAMILARRFGIVHFLMFSAGRNDYVERTVNVDALLLEEGEEDA